MQFILSAIIHASSQQVPVLYQALFLDTRGLAEEKRCNVPVLEKKKCMS